MVDDRSVTKFLAEPEAQEDFELFFTDLNGVLAREDVIEITREIQIGVGEYTPIEVRTEK